MQGCQSAGQGQSGEQEEQHATGLVARDTHVFGNSVEVKILHKAVSPHGSGCRAAIRVCRQARSGTAVFPWLGPHNSSQEEWLSPERVSQTGEAFRGAKSYPEQRQRSGHPQTLGRCIAQRPHGRGSPLRRQTVAFHLGGKLQGGDYGKGTLFQPWLSPGTGTTQRTRRDLQHRGWASPHC